MRRFTHLGTWLEGAHSASSARNRPPSLNSLSVSHENTNQRTIMKTIIFCATALTMTGATMAAGSDWTTLDREVEALSSSLSPQGGGVAIGGYLDLGYTNNSDTDTSDFGGNNLRLGFSAENSGFGITVGTQWGGGVGIVTDAYVTTDVGGMNGTAGRFKSPMGASGSRAEHDQFFQDRSAIGSNFAGRSSGIMVGGDSGAFNWAVAIQDGADGPIDEYQISLHADFTVMGSGSAVEGCYGAADGMGLVIGASMSDDGGATESATVIDASLTSSTFSFSAEFADTPAGFSSTGVGASTGAVQAAIGDSPMAIGATYAVGTDWEIGIRYQDLDNAAGDTDMDIAANYYVNGHDVKYTIGFSMPDNDADTGSDTITIGLQVGF